MRGGERPAGGWTLRPAVVGPRVDRVCTRPIGIGAVVVRSVASWGWRIESGVVVVVVAEVAVVAVGAGSCRLRMDEVVVGTHRVFEHSVGGKGSSRSACRLAECRPFLCAFWRRWGCCPKIYLLACLLYSYFRI